MSTYIKLKSVCGDSSASVDIYDVELNPHGVVCCNNCNSIIEARESWAKQFNYSF
jgi:hypothetical protein